MREFLLSFQLPIIQLVPEIPRHQCVGCYLCVRLNGATGPPPHNEARPFAVTPPHQKDREARSEDRNKKAGSGKEKEGEMRRIKTGGEKTEWARGEFDGGKRQQQNVAEEVVPMERLSVSKQDGLRRKGFSQFSQKPQKMRREGKRVGP